jgi:FkbM family methyltransferase
VIAAVRRLAAWGPIGRVLKSPRVEPLIATVLRASPVRERLRFLARELRPSGEPNRYHLRSNGAAVLVRHGTPDVAALGEVFYEHQYEPPEEVASFLGRLGRPAAILDLGANVGFFAAFASTRFSDARIVTFEPDPANAELLQRTAVANGWDWDVVEAAAATADGVVPFASGRFTHSRIEEGGAEVRALDVMPFLERCDFVKIDIEGAEWAILGDPRFAAAGPPALVLEHHPYLCPEPEPQTAALRLLAAAGYEPVRTFEFPAGQGLVWALRRIPQRIPAP